MSTDTGATNEAHYCAGCAVGNTGPSHTHSTPTSVALIVISHYLVLVLDVRHFTNIFTVRKPGASSFQPALIQQKRLIVRFRRQRQVIAAKLANMQSLMHVFRRIK